MVEYQKNLIAQNARRVAQQEKTYNYYIGDKDAILAYLTEVQGITFDSDTISDFQKVFINVTKKVINKLAVVYRNPASRYFIDKDGAMIDDYSQWYNSVLPFNINSTDKTAHRYAKAFNTSLTRVGFNGKLFYKVLPSYLYNVKTDDNDKMVELSYARYFNDGKEPELYVVTWTDKEHYRQRVSNIIDLSVKGNKIPIGDNKGMINPYGKIPYAVLRLEEQNDFWGEGQTDLVNFNEQINFLLSDLINSGVIMQSWGTPVAINCGLSYKNEKGGASFRKVRLGAKHPLVVENAKTDEVEPSFEFKSANPLLVEVRETIDWMIKLIAITKGLDPNSFLQEVKATSGFSKVVDSLDEMELRQDDIEPCRAYEEERHDLTQRVLEAHKSEIKDYKSLKGYFVCDFAEIKPIKSLDEDIKEKEFKLKHNLITPIDIMRDGNPDLSDEELQKKYEDNRALNAQLVPSSEVDNKLGKIPLALQELALARERANTVGDTALSEQIGKEMEILTNALTSKND